MRGKPTSPDPPALDIGGGYIHTYLHSIGDCTQLYILSGRASESHWYSAPLTRLTAFIVHDGVPRSAGREDDVSKSSFSSRLAITPYVTLHSPGRLCIRSTGPPKQVTRPFPSQKSG
ncbi:hypothetical protein CC1G_15611 [Coprinopsis cinerea okayama7|uniref:Uncharacterized protein n=1 Tax=Coprinopsis cinerea (strain Okayama-7 / 130 / ATCC MYA-4618 / FGSC 9003) TaxID=240176 RepID=D6RNE1_COPC7|nr:hypothetical protein CC1G_15611 [Coprinopsis cinerea okayama7\|eukprot:XP_002911069.1 hypothetical protein CC1G_15611 [Coprinopsis cinerea okayama7\